MADFPRLIEQAARAFSQECSAFTQIRLENNQIRVRMQAVEIMQQFVGDVEFGRDPKGLLFYRNSGDFAVRDADFKYSRHGSGDIVTVEIEFREHGGGVTFAKFFARVDTRHYSLPNPSGQWGVGRFSPFLAATSQTNAVRVSGSNRLTLQYAPLRLRARFDGIATTPISNAPGLLIFTDLQNLATQVGGQRVVADVAGDRIVFHPQNNPKLTVALFLPGTPLQVGIQQNVPSTWEVFDPFAKQVDVEAEEGNEA